MGRNVERAVHGTRRLNQNLQRQALRVGRQNSGLGALDIMIAYQLYLNATEMGIGTKVNLWDKPLWE